MRSELSELMRLAASAGRPLTAAEVGHLPAPRSGWASADTWRRAVVTASAEVSATYAAGDQAAARRLADEKAGVLGPHIGPAAEPFEDGEGLSPGELATLVATGERPTTGRNPA